jgi:hypothetical protein
MLSLGFLCREQKLLSCFQGLHTFLKKVCQASSNMLLSSTSFSLRNVDNLLGEVNVLDLDR